MNLSNEEIIRELKAGNHLVFEQVFKKYYATLCFEARGYLGVKHLVEEVVCDVFTRIWQNRDTLYIKTSLREYLIKAVHNTCIDYYRHLKAQDKLKEGFEQKQEIAITLKDIGENPLDYILTQELEQRINKAIELLPEQYKKTFTLSRFHDLTYDEIAAEMGISVNSVKTNIKNALSKLRASLGEFLSLLLL
ncbi:MAG TPA: RNA polymerase sigma-70 factor [Bacteroidales bacterium]|nr:RNA polymerase sigma-70 factor [Bacteroidales bacterium]